MQTPSLTLAMVTGVGGHHKNNSLAGAGVVGHLASVTSVEAVEPGVEAVVGVGVAIIAEVDDLLRRRRGRRRRRGGRSCRGGGRHAAYGT